jgi:DUF4097 and DUF4098 domain-containing protein YvlB
MRARLTPLSVAVILVASNALAAGLTRTERITRDLPLYMSGSLWIDNPVGSIEIVGTDAQGASITVVKTVNAPDKASLKEAEEQTFISFEGDQNVRLIRTIVPPVRRGWTSTVTYTVRVPRTVDVKVAAKMADRIRLANIHGNVTVKSFTGTIIFDGVSGSSIVDTVNGHVIYHYQEKPRANAQVQAVSADIDVYVPGDSNFNWFADTIRGDVMTNLPVRVTGMTGTQFHGALNAPGGPTLTLQTLLGNVRMLVNGSRPNNARSIRDVAVSERISPPSVAAPRPSQRIQLPFVGGSWIFSAPIADISVAEIRGSARVETGAGEIQLGVVYGSCTAVSLGGPLNLGDILGPLDARTSAGDVLVRAARYGGTIWTAGGTIRVLYTGGPTKLRSGGGDIVVRQAAGSINAETRSGDINITTDPNSRTQRIEARTTQGNVILNVSPQFGADIDATVTTSDPDAIGIHSDFNLTVRKEQFGNRTRIHATGKVNGGGERVELVADEGDIHITSLSTAPVTVMSPR